MAQITYWQDTPLKWSWEKVSGLNRFGFILAAIAIIIGVLGYLNQHHNMLPGLTDIFGDFYANVSSELISIVITVLVLEGFYERRQNAQELSRLKAMLGSDENFVTKIAVAELKLRGWLYDKSLEGTDLSSADLSRLYLMKASLPETRLGEANLSNAKMSRANLSNATLRKVNLSGASLTKVNLSGAFLAAGNLSGAKLYKANLSEAYLRQVNLSSALLSVTNLSRANLRGANLLGAELSKANLSGANMRDARLDHANMYGVICNEDTILPDESNWTPDVGWTKFGAVVIENRKDWQTYRREHGLDDD